jgi:hypothetical protein
MQAARCRGRPAHCDRSVVRARASRTKRLAESAGRNWSVFFHERDECFVGKRARLAIVWMGQNLDMLFVGALIELDFPGSRAGTLCVMAKQGAD